MISVGILLGVGSKLGIEGKLRANAAKNALLNRKIKHLILSGGYTSHISEARVYYDYLVSIGVPSHCLTLEETSKDTIGNAAWSKKIIEEKNLGKDIAIITSNYHQQRAQMIFNHIFGEQYTIQTINVKTPFTYKTKIKELALYSAESIALQQIPVADTTGAIEFILNNLPQYQ